MTPLSVDVVVVAYNSRDCLRACVERLAGAPGVSVVVVDNACPERSYEVVEDLSGVRVIHMPTNGGFARGCNAGWRAGSSEHVLLLNPDSQLEVRELAVLASELDDDPLVGIVGPRTLDADGGVSHSIRRFPSLRSTYAQALFLHRALPNARWVDEVVRDAEAYERRSVVDWLSGACLLVRRSALEAIGGLDEGFLFYSEDVDLCRRVTRQTGLAVLYSPDATCVHDGGRSSPRAQLLPMLAASRLRYARRYRGRVGFLVERVGIGLGEALHAIAGRGGPSYRRGHLRALGVVLRGDDAYRSPQFGALGEP
ncbi:MAG TPA: glycosyltransferase family 2 protein [Gaiella sp.]|nr:glycosyltransferase family 2 protein [Gaiella sp.]